MTRLEIGKCDFYFIISLKGYLVNVTEPPQSTESLYKEFTDWQLQILSYERKVFTDSFSHSLHACVSFMSSVLCLRPFSGPSDSWLYPLTDSSYDSLENELDNSSGGSPGFSSRRHIRPKPLRGSLDSITVSDYDQDTDPDNPQTQADSPQGQKLHPLGRSRGRRQDADLSCSTQDSPTVDSTLDSLSLDGRHRQRRCSEPAIAYMAKFRPCASESTDGLSGEDEDDEEELSKKPIYHTLAHTHSRGHTRRGGGESVFKLHGVRSAAQEVSSPSLSSTPNSPAPTRSSLDSLNSLHSLSSNHTCTIKRGLHPTKTHLPSSSPPLPVPLSVPSLPFTIGSALTPGGQPDLGTCPKDSAPKEAPNWGTLKGCGGLHPNSWLKKGRRLSLTQQDNLDKEEEDKTGVSKIIFIHYICTSTC